MQAAGEDREMSAHPSCEAFLARYTEYADGRMEAREAARWRNHVERCARCARYDRVVRCGGEMLRSLSTETVSEDFEFGLRHRLQHVREEERERSYGSGASAAAALLVAGVLAAIAWSPLLRELGPRLRNGSSVMATEPADGEREADPGEAVPGNGFGDMAGDLESGIDVHRSVRPLLSPSYRGAPEIVWIETPGRAPTPLFLGIGESYVDRPGPFSPLVIAPPAFHLTSSVPTANTR